MKNMLFSSIKLTLCFVVLLMMLYPSLIWGIAQLLPNKGLGSLKMDASKPYYANIAQSFADSSLFWSRPSAVGYNAAAAGGSNKGPNNPDYLKNLEERIVVFLTAHPYCQRKDIPIDLLTASGSGLDPHLSPRGIEVQIQRVAQNRRMTEAALRELVQKHTEEPFLGLFGPAKVNVVELNYALVNQ